MQRLFLAVLILIVTLFVSAQAIAGAVIVGAEYLGSNPEQFGNVAVGSTNTLSRSIEVDTNSSNSVSIGVSATGAGYSISGGTCLSGPTLTPPNGSCTLTLAFAPTAPGPATGNLAIECATVAVSGGIIVNCADVTGDTTNIALQGNGVNVTNLPSLGRLGLSLLALSLFAMTLWSVRRKQRN